MPNNAVRELPVLCWDCFRKTVWNVNSVLQWKGVRETYTELIIVILLMSFPAQP